MSADATARTVPSSLVWATNLDVLPTDRVVERRDVYFVARSPSNPGHWWGNLLIFDDPPLAGDAPRWEQRFADEFAGEPRVRHRTFAWDRWDGAIGGAREEFVAHSYHLDETVGLIAAPEHIRAHPRENRDVVVRSLNPLLGAEEELWEQVVELQVASHDERLETEDTARQFSRQRLSDLRILFRAGHGDWYVALDPRAGEVLGSCGIVVTGGRGRFQFVDTAAAHRRRGICSRLVVEAAHHAAQRHSAVRLVIAADAHYHALGLYESLGFQPVERVVGVCRPPGAALQARSAP